MAIIIKTKDPEQLHNAFVDSIKELRITTWVIDDDGDFTIKREAWRNHAWMYR